MPHAKSILMPVLVAALATTDIDTFQGFKTDLCCDASKSQHANKRCTYRAAPADQPPRGPASSSQRLPGGAPTLGTVTPCGSRSDS